MTSATGASICHHFTVTGRERESLFVMQVSSHMGGGVATHPGQSDLNI